MSNRFDYIDHENAKQVADLLQKSDVIDQGATNAINGVKYFLKNDIDKIVVNSPSVSAAERQMKGVAAIFNEKKILLQDAIAQIEKVQTSMNGMIEKLTNSNVKSSKVTKLREAVQVLEDHTDPIKTLIEQVDQTKKLELEKLKKRILKAERVKHFKNLH